MDERTRAYLAGRFGDYYRRTEVPRPPAPHQREWGYIPWAAGGETRMIRHRSMTELGTMSGFLHQEEPRHVYYSAGYYRDPGASTMGAKDWQGADLIFDLDADHLPGANPEHDSFREMLAACKDDLLALLDMLDTDFGVAAPAIVFSGNRGYHVHVRDDAVQSLDRRARRDIVEYVRGEGVSVDTVVYTSHVSGAGRSTPAQTRRLDPNGGWSSRVHREVLDFVDQLLGTDREAALAELMSLEGIGEQRATTLLETMADRREELEAGNVDIHPAFVRVLETVVDRAVERQGAAIDEPVTTDLNRLIRLPGSLHGGSGLRVMELDRDKVEEFDPLVDAIPSTFTGHDIAIDVNERTIVEVGTERRELDPGPSRLPEYKAIHLMARDEARKVPESTV